MSKETQNKKNYLAPSWRVVSFKTERGAFTSGLPISGDPATTNQIQQYQVKTEGDGVTGWGTFN